VSLRFPLSSILVILAIFFAGAGDAFAQTKKSTGKSEFSNFEERYQEVDYWDEIHARENEKRLLEKKQQEEKRTEIKNGLPSLVEQGGATPPPPPPVVTKPKSRPPPSFFEGKGDYVALGSAALLMCALTAYTLFRHRREKEIRLLKGTYLSDGTEAAWITMPAFFETPVGDTGLGLSNDESSESEKNKKDEKKAAEDAALAEFFKAAPEHLAEIRDLLPELTKDVAEKDRREILLELHKLIVELKTRADCWYLRPVWQLSSALELLVKRLADKCKEATPSTTRTIANAIDLLAELCVPDVRPDLIINPPIAVLAVDDDPLCLRAVMFALQKAEMIPDTAQTGEGAVALAAEKSYDVIFMDIKMPGIDGLEACTQLHKFKKNETTPVVFVTVQSDFHTRAKSTLAGGTDLMVKPFLMFEITVKALAFSMRKRLQLAASLRREVASQTGASQIEGMGMAVLPPPVAAANPAEPAAADVPRKDVNGAVLAEQHEKKIELSHAELPELHMAAVAPLEREKEQEQRVAQAVTNLDWKSRKKMRREKKIAEVAAETD
jgi:DNA-binding response OmpR family regulator